MTSFLTICLCGIGFSENAIFHNETEVAAFKKAKFAHSAKITALHSQLAFEGKGLRV